ncbi:DUF3037 domain-containing protein [Pedobacter glucosidilyticus]|uniref:DUF3037 domain-containing protein n=1 Tax=Pedobacter glucosidilyticus TaxID=1122941 RepID=UPI000428B95D|nr:DUF3037 domain-containing protein [Pedobacter glucosidilyticus]
MIKYNYQILRYIHDQVTGEFVNVGIVLFEAESKFLKSKVLSKFSRISNFFGEINGYFLLSALKHFQTEITAYTTKNDISSDSSLNTITGNILLKDDSALILSDVKSGLDINAEAALEDLYKRLVEKYIVEPGGEKRSDAYAWRKVYKEYFDKYGITSKLKDHTVNTNNDTIKFDKSWKNGVWNCYQTLSFDLQKEDSIKGKVYKWSGIIRELETADEKMNLYFLTTSPKSDKKKLCSFIKETLSLDSKFLSVKIISENEAEEFAGDVRKAMEKSDVL